MAKFKDSYPTAQDARTALYTAGYYPRHSYSAAAGQHRSEWRRLNSSEPIYVVAQRKAGDWVIIEGGR